MIAKNFRQAETKKLSKKINEKLLKKVIESEKQSESIKKANRSRRWQVSNDAIFY